MSRVERGAYSRIAHFAEVMSWYATPVTPERCVDPHEADDLVASCRIIQEIGEIDRGVVGGLRCDQQQWMATRRHGPTAPAESRFISVACEHDRPSTKPHGYGLYTSTETAGGYSMWRALMAQDKSGVLYPRPWYTWRLSADGKCLRVAELGTAVGWVQFIDTYPLIADGLVYPQWQRASESFDAVHITLPLIAAAQGLALRAANGIVPATFWDVETTFWLKWPFDEVRLLDAASDGSDTGKSAS